MTIVMGGLTAFQESLQIRAERGDRAAILRWSLSPLLQDLQQARTREELVERIATFHRAFAERGHVDHHLVLRDARGRTVAATLNGVPAPDTLLQASAAVSSPALAGGPATVTVLETAAAQDRSSARQWKSWWVHMGVTLSAILISLLVAIRFLVTRPLERLVDGVRKMEMGYWGEVEIPRGAWEIRWLAWRFRNMGTELQETVRRLVAAERRALTGGGASGGGGHTGGSFQAPISEPLGSSPSSALHQRLVNRCEILESAIPTEIAALARAREAWERDALEAGRLGDTRLRSRIEDAALRLLEPAAFERLERQIAIFTDSLQPWVARRQSDLSRAMEERGVPYLLLQHRVKHTAGVWRKMQVKGLDLTQVHDLIAFRVVVPTESDCYSVLGLVHGACNPVVGRFKDYIVAPKENGYQGLHTCVRAEEGTIFEVQIRSVAMHHHAERGDAAHSLYKAATPLPELLRRRRWWPRLWAFRRTPR